jgi:hypothetical protein
VPKGTKVDRCFQKVRQTKGDAAAARICQSATKTSLRTGKKPKGK